MSCCWCGVVVDRWVKGVVWRVGSVVEVVCGVVGGSRTVVAIAVVWTRAACQQLVAMIGRPSRVRLSSAPLLAWLCWQAA